MKEHKLNEKMYNVILTPFPVNNYSNEDIERKRWEDICYLTEHGFLPQIFWLDHVEIKTKNTIIVHGRGENGINKSYIIRKLKVKPELKQQIEQIIVDCKKKGLHRAATKLQKLLDKGTAWIDDKDDKEFWSNGMMEKVDLFCTVQHGKTGMRLNLITLEK